MPDWIAPYLTWAAWAPVFSTTAIAGVAVWALKTPLSRWIEGRISSGFDTKLEGVKADLRAREAEIAALRSGALSSLAARQIEFDRRRIVAIDTIWREVQKLTPQRTLSNWAEVVNFDAMFKKSTEDKEVAKSIQAFAEMMWNTSGMNNYQHSNEGDLQRPFLPEIAWSLFSAYRQMAGFPVAQFGILKSGVNTDIPLQTDAIIAVAKSALPHQAEFIEKNGTVSFPFLLGELEGILLQTLKKLMEDNSSDETSVAQAAKINAAVNRLSPDPAGAPIPPGMSAIATKSNPAHGFSQGPL